MNTLSNGRTKVPAENNYFKNKKYFSVSLLEKIDTAAIYVEAYSYRSSKEDFSPVNNEIARRTDGWYSVYKFYSNGCLNSFYFENDHEIKKEDIDPEREGDRGVYYLDDRNNIIIDQFVIVGYGFRPIYGIDKNIIKVKGDTLLIKNDLTRVNVYVKRKIPEDWLIYKADW